VYNGDQQNVSATSSTLVPIKAGIAGTMSVSKSLTSGPKNDSNASAIGDSFHDSCSVSVNGTAAATKSGDVAYTSLSIGRWPCTSMASATSS
jgi:hypothetical protein